MLKKLAFKNIEKSFRDYAIYFVTLTFGVCIFYMFNSIYAQKEIMAISNSTILAMRAVMDVLTYVSAFVAVILGFLIVYAKGFFIRRRKMELGIYLTLGMSRKSVNLIFLMETLLIAAIALVVGLFLGVLGSQVMSLFTAKIFESDLTNYKFVFSYDAAIKSIAYFAVIFLVVAVCNIVMISKVKLIDLLYGGRKNQTVRLKNPILCVVLFAISLMMLVVAYYFAIRFDFGPETTDAFLAVILGAAGTALFFFSLSGFFMQMVRRRKKTYLKDLNMFVVQQLNSKFNTNFVSLSIICIALFLVIVVFSTGYSAQEYYSDKLKEQVAYDFSLYNMRTSRDDSEKELPEIYGNLPENMRENAEVRNYAEYVLYNTDEAGGTYGDYDLDFSVLDTDVSTRPLYFMQLSSFNRLRQINGESPSALPASGYQVVYADEALAPLADQFVQKGLTIPIHTEELNPVGQAGQMSLGNRYFGGIVFVVEDALTDGMQMVQRVLNVNCVNEDAASSFQQKITDYQNSPVENRAFSGAKGKQEIYASSISDKALASFLGIYLGMIFMISCAAVLSIQQLSYAAENRERYRLLRRLGADQKMINRALFLQILFYFLVPLLLAVIHAAVGIYIVYQLLSEVGKVDLIPGIIVTALFVVLIYGVYFVLTYFGSKSTIKR